MRPGKEYRDSLRGGTTGGCSHAASYHLALATLVTAGCVGGTLGPYRTYVKPDGTEGQRKVDYTECSTGGRIAEQYVPGLSMLAEAELRDCMATKGWQKSQQGMVAPNAMDAVQPSK